MFTLRSSSARGHFDHGWLNTYHTFSFARYVDRRHMGFRTLRVINEDVVAPGEGFGQHPHDNMEIVTWILSGTLAHRDTLGNTKTLSPGEVQRMSAGSGLEHSEFNASSTQPVHLLQIWILPARRDVEPGYEQKHFAEALRRDVLKVIVSPDAREGSLRINQDASIYTSLLTGGKGVTHAIAPTRHVWLQLARGSVEVTSTSSGAAARLSAGDGLAVLDEAGIKIAAVTDGEFLLFDLA